MPESRENKQTTMYINMNGSQLHNNEEHILSAEYIHYDTMYASFRNMEKQTNMFSRNA